MAFVIDDISLPIKNGGVAFSLFCCFGERVRSVKSVSGIKEDDIVAMSGIDGLVHGIVYARVRLAYKNNVVWVALVAVVLDIALYVVHRRVSRASVNDDMLHSGVTLFGDAVQSPVDCCFSVISDRSDGETNHSSVV